MLRPVSLVGLCAFVLSLALTPACRDLFRRLGIVDRPDHDRKLHAEPVPHMGGVPILLAYLASCLLLAPFSNSTLLSFSLAVRALPAGLIIFGTGVLDDIRPLKPWQKLCGQTLGAVCAYWSGIRIESMAGYDFGGSQIASLLVTVIWLIGCTNAFNLIDGIDGLASGVGLFATATMLIAGLLQNNMVLAMATAPLVGALLGFLRYNFNPASIFLGDSGSLIIGYMLGCFGVVWSQKSATILGMTAPLMALGIPILDTCLSVIRRFLRHQPIFGADSDHIHHRLLKRGLTPKNVALVMYAVAGIGAVFSLLQSVVNNHIAGAILVLFCAATWIGIQHLGYTEFSTARRMLLAGTFQQALDAQLRLRSFEQVLDTARSVEECWDSILAASQTFDFVEVRLCIAGTVYHKRLRDTNGDLCWTLRVPLPEGGYINFMRLHDSSVFSMGVAPFIDVVRKNLTAKCTEFGLHKGPSIVMGHDISP